MVEESYHATSDKYYFHYPPVDREELYEVRVDPVEPLGAIREQEFYFSVGRTLLGSHAGRGRAAGKCCLGFVGVCA